MGVYIKGMEMPTDSAGTRLIIYPNGRVLFPHKTYFDELYGVEAIPVPDHGRLIDADAFLQDLLFPSKDFERGMRELVGDAPTIIPAEPPKEEAPAGPYDLLYEEGGPDA